MLLLARIVRFLKTRWIYAYCYINRTSYEKREKCNGSTAAAYAKGFHACTQCPYKDKKKGD